MAGVFECTRINGLGLPNRFVRSATWEGMADTDGSCTNKLSDLMVRLAEGGVGLIISVHTCVSPGGQAGPWHLAIHDDRFIPALFEMTTAVHNAGGKVVMQIAHAGCQSNVELTGQQAMGPSLFMWQKRPLYREMSIEDISFDHRKQTGRFPLRLPPASFPDWLTQWFQAQDIVLRGAADLRGFSTPQDGTGQRFPRALSFLIPMNPLVMTAIQQGPNQAYADEYSRVNHRLNDLSEALAAEIRGHGHRSQPLAASDRTDTAGVKGDFPHKTAATRAGLGWIGRHCQLITRDHGSWVRLGTVFTDMELSCGPPSERSFCGRCTRCVDACPAGALKGRAWFPGIVREEILDVLICDNWKKEHYREYHNGHVCGICSAVCPYSLKAQKKHRILPG